MADLKIRIVADLSKLRQDLSKAAKQSFTLGLGTGGGGGRNQQVADMTRAITTGFAASRIVLTGVERYMQRLYQASPALQATMGLVNQSLNILLRPIGDLLSSFLRPFAIGFLNFAIPFYKKSLINLNKPGGIAGGLIGGAAGAVAGGAGAVAAGGAIAGLGGATAGALGGSIAGPVGIVAGAILGSIIGALAGINIGPAIVEFFQEGLDGLKMIFTEDIPALWGLMKQGAANVAEFAGNMWDIVKEKAEIFGIRVGEFFTTTLPSLAMQGLQAITDFFFNDIPFAIGFLVGTIESFFLETLPSAVESAWDLITEFFMTTLPEAATAAWEGIVAFFTETLPEVSQKAWDAIVTFFTVTLPAKLVEGWNVIQIFFTETMPGWVMAAWEGLKVFFQETIPGWFDDMMSSFKKIYEEATGLLGRLKEGLAALLAGAAEAFSGGRSEAADDFILTKSGTLIKTNPEDTIMGFKGDTPPSSQGGGGGSVTMNFSINIQALDVNSMRGSAMDDLLRQIEERFKSMMFRMTPQGPFLA